MNKEKNQNSISLLNSYIDNREYITWILIITTVVVILYWQLLSSDNISIDTEDMVNQQDFYYYGWMKINRFGLVLTKALFSLLSIVPPLASILMMLTTVAYGIFWMLLINKVEGGKTLLCGGVFSLLFITSIPMLEISAFQCLSFEVSLAMLIAGTAIWSIWVFIDTNKYKYALIFIVLSVWVYGSYQAFVPLMASAISMTILLRYTSSAKGIETEGLLRAIVRASVLYILSLCSYLLTSALLHILLAIPSGDYTNNMIILGKVPVKDLVKQFISYLSGIFIEPTYGWSRLYLISYISLPVSLIIKFHLNKMNRSFNLRDYPILVLLFSCGVLSPFILPLVTGGGLVRAQFALPFVMALSIGFSISVISSIIKSYFSDTKCASYYAIALFTLAFMHWCIVPDVRLMWSDSMVKHQQQQITEEIITNIHSVGGTSDSHVVFLGQWHPTLNGSMMVGETLGRSLYEWDPNVRGGTNRRILGYLKVMGYDFVNPTDEDIASAEALGNSLSKYPSGEYVIKTGNLIVVRLS